MKKLLFSAALSFLTIGITTAQNKVDKLFLQNETKEVSIKEVGTNTIRYTHIGEDVIYTVNKNLIEKIEFSSGRMETFNSPFQEINSLLDVDKVFVTFNPSEIEGLEIKGDLFSKAVGVTTLSSVNNVNNRALTKLKTEAVMLGANALYIGNQFQRGNQYGNETTPGNSTMSTYSAKAYTSNVLDIEAARQMIENHKFYYHQRIELNRNGWSPNIFILQSVDKELNPILFDLGEIIEKDGNLYVSPKELRYKGESLQLVRVGENTITLMDRTDKEVINFDLLSEDHYLVKNQIKMVQIREEKEGENGY